MRVWEGGSPPVSSGGLITLSLSHSFPSSLSPSPSLPPSLCCLLLRPLNFLSGTVGQKELILCECVFVCSHSLRSRTLAGLNCTWTQQTGLWENSPLAGCLHRRLVRLGSDWWVMTEWSCSGCRWMSMCVCVCVGNNVCKPSGYLLMWLLSCFCSCWLCCVSVSRM